MPITMKMFCGLNLPGRDYDFWTWFYPTVKLINQRLLNLWKNNLIIGYISKEETERILLMESPGTFLLRFSDSVLGMRKYNTLINVNIFFQ